MVSQCKAKIIAQTTLTNEEEARAAFDLIPEEKKKQHRQTIMDYLESEQNLQTTYSLEMTADLFVDIAAASPHVAILGIDRFVECPSMWPAVNSSDYIEAAEVFDQVACDIVHYLELKRDEEVKLLRNEMNTEDNYDSDLELYNEECFDFTDGFRDFQRDEWLEARDVIDNDK